MILEESLQAPLAGFRLVRSVSRVILAPARYRIDDGGNEMIVAAAALETDTVQSRSVSGCKLLYVLRQFQFG